MADETMTSTSADVKAEVDVKAETDVKPELGAKPTVEGKTEEEVDALLKKASKQISFYFSDANLPVDKYLFTLTLCNDQGWVPIKTLISFSRMSDIQPLGVPFVAYALRQAIAEEGEAAVIAVSEDGENVRRAKELAAKKGEDNAWDRTVYVKGFGEDEDEQTQEKLEQYFEQFGFKVAAVRMRRSDGNATAKAKGKGKFKGSVFTEFAELEDAKKFLAQESLPKYAEEGDEMVKMSKDEYVHMKAKEKGIPESELRKPQPKRESNRDSQGASGAKQGGSRPEKFNAFRELERIKRGQAPYLATIPEGVAIVGKRPSFEGQQGGIKRDTGVLGKRGRDGDDEERDSKNARSEFIEFEYKGVTLKADRETGKVVDKSQVPFEKDSAVKFANAGAGGDWKAFKELLKPVIPAPFLAFPAGSTEGTVAKTDGSTITDEEVQKLTDLKLDLGGNQVEWSRLNEEEMQTFWAQRANFQGARTAKELKEKAEIDDAQRERDGKRGGGGGGGGRGGGRGGGGRGGGRGGRGGGGRGRGGRGGGRGGHRDRDGGNNRNRDPAAPPSLKTE